MSAQTALCRPAGCAWGYLAQMRSESLQSLTKFNCFCGKGNANVKECIKLMEVPAVPEMQRHMRVWVCEYVSLLALLPLPCAKLVLRGLVITLNSIRLGKVQGVITDQTASKQTIITLWWIPGAQNNNCEWFAGNDITLFFFWKHTLWQTLFLYCKQIGHLVETGI